jgi:class 3 adenylate cyclase/ketosteroid isomerase-like protein
MKADPETEAAVLEVLERFDQSYAGRDAQKLMAMYARDPDLVLIGTGRDEIAVGATESGVGLREDLSQLESISVQRQWLSPISAAGPVAWVAGEWLMDWTSGGQEGHALMRRSLVLERRSNEWLIVHSHASFPAYGQPEGQHWPTPIETIATAVSSERPDLRARAAPDGTVTMLFTDIENSSNITERLGDTQWLGVLRRHNAVVREQVQEHSCFEVKSQGDGFMIASQSARRAIHCAIGIQRSLDEVNGQSQEPIQVRMGLHTGEVLKDADDFFGKHVILASRIAGKARGGEILVSSILKELTESGGDIRFGPAREFELKGLTGSYRVHDVIWRDSRN